MPAQKSKAIRTLLQNNKRYSNDLLIRTSFLKMEDVLLYGTFE